MSTSEQINKSKKRRMLLNSEIYELDPEDHADVDSPEVLSLQTSSESLTLDASQDPQTLDQLSQSVNFDHTVGPGAAPEGFLLVDETVCDDNVDSDCQNNLSTKTTGPIFKVMFRDNETVRKYAKTIEDFLHQLLPPESTATIVSSDLALEIWEQSVVGEEGEILISSEAEESQESIDNQLFMIDTEPKLRDDLDVPTYGKKFEKILQKSTEDTTLEPDPADECVSKLSCFNCGDNHNLRDCTKPRNPAMITKNRKQFNARVGPRNGRYHLDDDQKFGHFMPGQLSKNLRKALGLKENELPKHIYRMRILGYPPGWLEEARVQHSGLTLFNSDGNAVADPTEEEGEVIIEGDKDEFDVKKIHDFPGFNVTAPQGTRDNYVHHQAPCMQDRHSKDVMLLQLSNRKVQDGYRRKKMPCTRPTPTVNASDVPNEMEVVDVEECVVEAVPTNGLFIPPLPKEISSRPPEPSLPDDMVSQADVLQTPEPTPQHQGIASTWLDSPSLSDLEVTKKNLLAELNDSNSLSNAATPVNHGKSSSMLDTPVSGMSASNSTVTPQMNHTASAECTPNARTAGNVKSVDLGTPVLQSTSPYSRLPPSEKFSKDICDILNFENLPDSTGKYEKMSGLLQKVRSKVASLQQE